MVKITPSYITIDPPMLKFFVKSTVPNHMRRVMAQVNVQMINSGFTIADCRITEIKSNKKHTKSLININDDTQISNAN